MAEDAGTDKLEDSLDGLLTTVAYCEEYDLDDLAARAAKLYQDLGAQSPDEHWNDATADEIRELRDDNSEDR